ncbi:LacI family DNA-binding transcriptional regulator [Microbacterium psychrotolerans]|uniref:LacI family DNA-binding transcriptional regulator n=1 Tax=Microbacterium psychrotolerans TaxID=3068321 RepID=UPI003AAAC7EA
MSRTTLKDVAQAAGVSPTTVSFVVNRRADHIPESTRRRVEQAVADLGYVPSARGRALASGRSRVVVCVSPSGPAAAVVEEFKRELSDSLMAAGFTCVFLERPSDGDQFVQLWRHIDPACVVSWDALTAAELLPLERAGVATVTGLVMGGTDEDRAVDQQGVGRAQVEHLADLGHRHIAYAMPVMTREDESTARARLAGATAAARESGLADLTVSTVDLDAVDGQRAVEAWTRATPSVTAVAAYGDLQAVTILEASRRLGVRVPEDLAIIGVDDLPLGQLVFPTLSTVALDLRAAAADVAARILAVVEPAGTTVPVERRPPRVVVRESTLGAGA